DHTTSDDASRYRSADELAEAWKREPIGRLQRFLHRQGLWDGQREQQLQQELSDQGNAAVERLRTMPEEAPGAALDHLYQRLPDRYRGQRDELVTRSAAAQGGNHG